MTDPIEPDESARAHESELSERDREKYRVLSELARGGMGVVLRGHDKELGRDVAIKVLDPALADREEVRERFVEEAQIGGQLQHPGIVPVYELGLMADERPWFAMKLIKGRTLAELLADRASVEADRGKLLGIFEAVCQTMAYAHSKGVIHRDLKPANVMVGAFGEVQVVDWGLAKVLVEDGDRTKPVRRESLLTVIETVRSKDDSSGSSASIVGSVLGTPAYMPPEQAQGNIDRLDARADVFALGAILCEILTGKPPYVPLDGQHVLDLAADAVLEPALARIHSAQAHDEMKELCRRCLGPARGSRPKDAAEVATAIQEHIANTEERAHRAQLQAAEEKLNAERASRRVQVTLMAAGTILLVIAGVVGGNWWLEEQQTRREAELSEAFNASQPEILAAYRDGNYERARQLALAAQRLVEAGEPSEELRQRAKDAVVQSEERLSAEQARLAEAQRLTDFEGFLQAMEIRLAENDPNVDLGPLYEEGFAAFGITPEDPNLIDVLDPYRDTPLGIQMARGFDGWAAVLRQTPGVDPYRIDLLTGVGQDLDTDPIRADVRRALVEWDMDTLLDLREQLDLDQLPPETILAIGRALAEGDRVDPAAQVLSRGAVLHPSNFLLNHAAAGAHYRLSSRDDVNPGRMTLQFLQAAIALQPNNAELHVKLSDVTRSLGDHLRAWEADQVFLRLAPERGWNWRTLATDAWMLGLWDEALEFYERALDRRPDDKSMTTWKTVAEAYAGRITLEDAVTRLEEHARRVWSRDRDNALAARGYLLTIPPEGGTPDPKRALDMMLEFPDAKHHEYWMSRAVAHVLSGEGAEAQRSLAKLSLNRSDSFSWHEEALYELVLATAHHVDGNEEEAKAHHKNAMTARAGLIGGREDGWSTSWMRMVFDRLEPILERR